MTEHIKYLTIKEMEKADAIILDKLEKAVHDRAEEMKRKYPVVTFDQARISVNH